MLQACAQLAYIRSAIAYQTVILSEAKDLPANVSDLIAPAWFSATTSGKNQDSVSREIDLPEVLRFAQDDRTEILSA
jgi:hypothetical protein